MLAVLAACGGGTNNGNNGGGLNPAFAKQWTGASTISGPGLNGTSYAAQITISGVNGNSATVTQVCLDSSGSMTVTGSGNSAVWNGTLDCPPLPQAGANCSLTLTFTSASATLSANGTTLNATGTGTVTGCGLNTTFTNVFQGT